MTYSIVIVGFVVPNIALVLPSDMPLADPIRAAEQAEKACTFFCQLAQVGNKFVSTKEGKTAIMWVLYLSVPQVAQYAGLIAIPSLDTTATLIAFVCASTYNISTIVGPEAIVQ